MSVLTVTEVRDYMTIQSDATDSKVTGFISAAEAHVANLCGPLAPTAVSARVAGGWGPLELPVRPVVSLTTVTPSYGSALDVSTLDVDPYTGLVGFIGYASTYVPYFPTMYYTVAYMAGWNPLPDDLRMAVKEYFRYLWISQRAGTNSPNAGGSVAAEAKARADDLMSPYIQVAFA